TCTSPDEIRPHLLEDLDLRFSEEVDEGDIVIAGRNFGCGSSREQPVVGLKAAGISAIIATSFARIFYRSAINQGLLLIESPVVVNAWKEGDTIEIDIEKSEIRVAGHAFQIPPLPAMLLAIRDAGGLLASVRVRLAGERGMDR
ncbi:3-isopropylmalate dehydratase, partial [Gemmatimonadota bacterium]